MQRCLLLPLIISSSILNAQELIPNGGFEELIQCPDWQSQLDRTAHWFDPSEQGTPDYYHACATNPWFATPQSTAGFQIPFDGEAYTAIYLWTGWQVTPEVREYLEVQLTEPLVEDRCYRFSLRVNLADFSGYTTDAFGVRFYMDSVILPDYTPPGDAPHIALAPGAFLSRDDWTLLEGEYTAVGGERFVMIGNYLFDAETDTQELPGGPPNVGDLAYALVDEVSLVQCNALDVPETWISGSPYVSDGTIHWTRQVDAGASYRVYDASGRELLEGTLSDHSIRLPDHLHGVLVLECRGPKGRVVHRLVID